MEFLKEKKFSELNSFEKMLKFIQINYMKLYSIILANASEEPTTFPDAETALAKESCPSLRRSMSQGAHISHAFLRCFTTRDILEKFFMFAVSPLGEGGDGDVTMYEINIGGKNFPDHTFLVLKNNTLNETYILQSYYFGYLFGGKYGLIKLDYASSVELEAILRGYVALSGTVDVGDFAGLNARFEKFTGIVSSRHAMDSRIHEGLNDIQIIVRHSPYETFMNAIVIGIDNILRKNIELLTSGRLSNVPIQIDYRVYHAFNTMYFEDAVFHHLTNLHKSGHFLGMDLGYVKDTVQCRDDGTVRDFYFMRVKVDTTISLADVELLYRNFNIVVQNVSLVSRPILQSEADFLERYEQF